MSKSRTKRLRVQHGDKPLGDSMNAKCSIDRSVICRCGCGRQATETVISEERGTTFLEHCCKSSADYMEMAANELGAPFYRKPIGNTDYNHQ